MWKVEVSEFNRHTFDYITYRGYFNSKSAAMEYIGLLADINANIYLEDMTPIGDGEYTNGEVICIKEATVY